MSSQSTPAPVSFNIDWHTNAVANSGDEISNGDVIHKSKSRETQRNDTAINTNSTQPANHTHENNNVHVTSASVPEPSPHSQHDKHRKRSKDNLIIAQQPQTFDVAPLVDEHAFRVSDVPSLSSVGSDGTLPMNPQPPKSPVCNGIDDNTVILYSLTKLLLY